MERIRAGIKYKYSAVSTSAEGYFKYPVGHAGATRLGYDEKLLSDVPDDLLKSFCGVGNPFSISPIDKGSTVLDLGCGAGFDLYLASRMVGDTGNVIGVDLTEQMVEKARANLKTMQVKNGEVLVVSSELLPLADSSVDIVISNGVINLSPDKPRLFREAHRVLRSGGRLQFADIILEKELPPHLQSSVESWSQ